MITILTIVLALWFAKAVFQTLLGLSETIYGLTLLCIAGVLHIVIVVLEAFNRSWQAANGN